MRDEEIPGAVDMEHEQGLVIVRLIGEHDIATQRMVMDRLSGLIESGSPLVFDLSEATFADSTLAHTIKRVAAAGVNVALVVPRDAPRVVPLVLRATGIADMVPVVPSREQAMALLDGGGRSG